MVTLIVKLLFKTTWQKCLNNYNLPLFETMGHLKNSLILFLATKKRKEFIKRVIICVSLKRRFKLYLLRKHPTVFQKKKIEPET